MPDNSIIQRRQIGRDPQVRDGLRRTGSRGARTRTLLIQRGHQKQPNSSKLLPFTRVRVTRCWSLLAFMLDFAVLHSLKC
jgi:hypothetical protein